MFKLTVICEKRKGDLKLDGTESSLRMEIKKLFKLQVPSRVISLSKLPFDNNPMSLATSVKRSPKRLLSMEEEIQFSRDLKNGDQIYASVAAFEIGNYVCTGDELGSGAFSQVYRGYNKQTKQTVAIKVVDSNFLDTPKAREYHEHEKEIIANIRQENIVYLHDLIEVDEANTKFYYIVMEFCEGGSLDQYIKAKPLTESQARRCIYQLGKALEYLETKKIIHRDLKPQNVLLTSRNLDEATLKVCDFGFSRYYSVQNVIDSHPGTPLYESPDMLFNRPYNDNKSDLWALGAIFYEMLVGRPLFHTVRSLPELRAMVNQDPKNFVKFPPEIKPSRECVDLLLQLMDKDASKRIALDKFFRHPFLDSSCKKSIFSVPTGYQFEVEVSDDTSVAALKSALEKYANIPKEHQSLVLENGEELTDTLLISNITSIANGKNLPMFLFNRNVATMSMQVDPIGVTNEPEEVLQFSLEDAPIKHLLIYQHRFHHIYKQLTSYFNSCYGAYKKYDETLPFAWTQVRGLKALNENYGIQYKEFEHELTSLNNLFNSMSQDVKLITDGFDSTMNKMKDTALAAALQSGRKTLYDTVDNKKLADDFTVYKKKIDTVKNLLEKGNALKKSSNEIPNATELLQQWTTINKLKENIRTIVYRIKTAADTVYSHYIRATREVDIAKKAMKDSALKQDVSQCLEEMIEVGKESVQQAHANLKEINDAMISIIKTKCQANNAISNLFELKKQISAYYLVTGNVRLQLLDIQKMTETFSRQVIQLPSAYTDYLFEMRRRADFQRNFTVLGNSVNEKVNKMIQDENSRIELFRNKVSSVLSPDKFPNVEVTSFPARIEVSLPPTNSFLEKFSSPENQGPKMEEDDFTVLAPEPQKEVELLIKENARLRGELTDLLKQHKQTNSIDLLEENAKLRDKIKDLQATQDKFFEDYEKRFTNSQIKLKCAEDKERSLLDTIENMKNSPVNPKDDLSSKIEAERKQLQSQLVNVTKNYEKERIEKEDIVRRYNDMVKTQEMLKIELHSARTTMDRTAAQLQAEQLDKKRIEQQMMAYKEQCEDASKKYDAISTKSKLNACPMCYEVFTESQLLTHIEQKHDN